MKVRKMLFLAVAAIIFFAANYSFAQVNHKEGDCSKKCAKECGMTENTKEKENCSSECTTKTGDSQGIVSDSVKICPVSGEKIDGSEGEPVKFTYLGKEYLFCCSGCVKKFKAEPIKYIKEELNCPVMGEPIDKNVSTIHDGVKYYFCCNPCIKKFEKEPQKYLDKLK
ncbi:MAG: YHS domain-containing protein [Ignavibacteriae bacterium]|nr:YHS domain-containing protein [Ignavibacteriota bacterium]